MTWLINLKSKLVVIFGAIAGLLLLYSSHLKKVALRKELKQTKAVSKAKDKSNKALVEGIENENKDNTLDYFDDKPD